MPLLPISTNRTSAPLNNQRLLFQLNNDQLAIQRQYDQLSTGRKVLRLSDDPAAAARALGLQRGIAHSEQLVRNANLTAGFYQSTDVALNRVDAALITARGVAVEAAQSVLSEDELEALAITIRQNMDSIVAAGNSMFIDHQLLGGVLQPSEALTHADGTVRFDGTDAVGQTKVGSGTNSRFTVTGADAIGVASVFHTGSSLKAALNEDTRLVDLRQGAGVRGGVISLSDGDERVELDLRNTASIGDVVDVLRGVTLGGRALGVRLDNDSITIQYADTLPGTLAIADLQGSSMAKDLNISNPQGFRAPPIIGDRLSPRVTLATPLDELDDGNGLDLSAGIVIDQGDERFTIDLSEAETIGDVLISINRSGAGVKAELDEAAGRIKLRGLISGVDYSVGENGGDAAAQLGIRTADENTLLDDLNRDRGIFLNSSGPDLVITRPDGVVLDLELSGAETIQDVIDLVANHPLNRDTRRVRLTLNDVGNGLELTSPVGLSPIRVTQPGASDVGTQLGLIPLGETESTSTVVGGSAILTGVDYRPRDAGGAIDTLLRLEKAVRANDISEIGRLQAKLDKDLDTSSRTRGRVGVWSANLQDLKSAVQDESVLMQSQLSDELDADLATVISELQARQAALEASMRFVGQTASLSLLDYL
ncbi:flagellin N-terminal helical domain-containing protein [Neorhodopirellula pilleata]|uniref:Flagellar hook-associated protein FlgL n=1 Tax=Neorhodopirellula pilleata TaxID=2714738 RepID=A0A5C6AY45_9BACT|nr:flagellin hook IN motif-containing protein [Neorhodopirellula pilleata]TWU04012.1 flagellar hook-associated protein FlgL [Neorhodopirellula pilleata]